jgi:tRNA pseudouridine38-40 synthase
VIPAGRVLRLVLAYDGSGFAGWQVQPAERTVQGVLLAAVRHLDPVAWVTGASRTDAGVHALGQVASLSTRSSLPPPAVQAALNARLPADVRVLACAEAAPGFDARRAACGKRYAYAIEEAAVAHPLLRRQAWHVRHPLDLPAMRQALGVLRGAHDFSAFCAAAGRGERPVCRLAALHARRFSLPGAFGRGRRLLVIAVSGDRFLHHMVRNIVGSAVVVGRGARPPGWMAEVLGSRERARAGPTAPAHGLALVRVRYAAGVPGPEAPG